MKIVLTGGGTGGHAYPAIGIAEALRSDPKHRSSVDLLYLGGKGRIEETLANEAGIPFVGLPSRKLGRALSLGNLKAVFTLGRGFTEALCELNRFNPDLVIGTGGYVSASVIMAQAVRRGKILIHEQNVVPGRTNLWLSRYTTRICVTFEDSLIYFPKAKTVETGLPIRSDLLHLPDKQEARKTLGLVEGRFTLLVLGGSQGARKLNEVAADSIPQLRETPIQVLHQAGPRNFDEANRRREEAGWEHYHVKAYIDDMKSAYAASDLVLSRSGASTVAEITVAGLPAIYVPYPFAYADHQRYNGEFVARNGGGKVINESDLSSAMLVEMIKRLIDSPDELARMAESSRKLGKPNAARDIAEIVFEM